MMNKFSRVLKFVVMFIKKKKYIETLSRSPTIIGGPSPSAHQTC